MLSSADSVRFEIGAKITVDNESWRTPEEQETLDNFRSKLDRGFQWQLWHHNELKAVAWDRETLEHAAEHLYLDENPRGPFPGIRWKNLLAGRVNYENLELEAPGGVRWMTTPTFVVCVATAPPVYRF
jgi:hypothetical protein